ncbi:hypothetical protein CIB84_010397, partial [Bambusicola thoracicus]
MTGAYLNSMYTQIEKQFNIPASLVGIINGSFEIGSFMKQFYEAPHVFVLNLLMFHFDSNRYHIESSVSPQENSSVVSLCHVNQSLISLPTEEPSTECEKEPGSLLWIFVMVGNLIRGMGETPVVPLGISYLEDFAKTENSPFYQGCLHTATVIGPFLGFLLASFCAKLFVDLESVDAGELTITPTDVRWVGAWWLGILICALVNFLAGLPFWFLPRSLVREGEISESEKTDFIPFLKALLRNPVYMLFIVITVLQFSAFIGMISFMPKYLEQQFGKSASDAIFLI